MMKRAARGILAFLLTVMLMSPSTSAQVLVRQHSAEKIVFPELEFEPPAVEEHELAGVTVLVLEDHSLPLATIYVRLKGGYGLFSRDLYAAASALPAASFGAGLLTTTLTRRTIGGYAGFLRSFNSRVAKAT